jgi:tetratricopeptide (TPR) repeat protein
MRMLHESLLPGALKEFRKAVAALPEEPEYRMLEAWVEYRTVKSGDEKKLAGAKVRSAVKRMLETTRTSSRAHTILGQLAHAEGDAESAEKHFKLAVRYDPDDAEANRFLRLLNMRSGAKTSKR